MAQSASTPTDEPLPTDDEDNPDYQAALDTMGLSEGDAYSVDERIYVFVTLKRNGEPYAEVLELSAPERNYRREARVDTLWDDYQNGNLVVGIAEVTFEQTSDTQDGDD